VGEFDFELLTNSETYYYNMITLIFDIGITTAAQLGQNLSSDGSKCYRIYKYNSNAGVLDLIAKYSAGQWLNVGDAINFSLNIGEVYFVKMRKISGNLTWTLISDIPSDIEFNLECSNDRYRYHMICLPLLYGSSQNISNAAELGISISSDGSMCYRIYRYNSTAGVLDLIAKYSGGTWLNVGDANNYTVLAGYPYFIKMCKTSGSVTWP
jgi:hypothetical protein